MALCHLQNKDIARARSAAASGRKKNPDWIVVKEAVAMVEYFSAISPGFEGWDRWVWPVPVPWEFVHSDETSRECFREASTLWEEVAKRREVGSVERGYALAWQLASTINDPSRLSEAVTLAETSLNENPTSLPIVSWAVARDLPFDRQRTIVDLERLCSANPESTEAAQALFILFSDSRSFTDAARILDAHKELYRQTGMWESWCFQRGQLYAVQGDWEHVEEMLEAHQDQNLKEKSRAMFARLMSQEEGWNDERLAIVDAEATRSGSDQALYTACEAHFQARDFRFVIDRGEELILRLGTEGAVRLALESAAASGQFQLCLDLIDKNSRIYGEQLPPAIVRLRAKCQSELSLFSEAIRSLNQLMDHDRSAADRLALFNLHIISGHINEATTTARTLLNDSSLPPGVLLHIADRLTYEDQHLARTFLSRAVAKGVDAPDIVAKALSAATKLGMHDETRILWAALAAAAAQPGAPIRTLSSQEIEAIQRESDDRHQDLHKQYKRGHLPIHHYCFRTGHPLAALFYREDGNSETCESLEIRHGTKTTPPDLTEAKGIYLDITSLLQADCMGLLPRLEQHFAHIDVSPWISDALNEEIATLARHDPNALRIARTIIELHDSNIIRIGSSDERVVAISFSTDTSQPMSDRYNLYDLLAHLIKGCYLSREEIEASLSKFGWILNEAHKEIRTLSRAFHLDLEAVRFLALTGLLSGIGRVAELWLDADCICQHRTFLAAQACRDRQAERLRALREHFRIASEHGTYRAVSNTEPFHYSGPAYAARHCLHDLLNLQRGGSILSCVEDRCLSGFSTIGDSPTCGVYDLLFLLRSSLKLNDSELFAAIHRLRVGDPHYLPLSTEELLFRLLAARAEKEDLQEIPDLAEIRRYHARCLLNYHLIQVPATVELDSDPAELGFLLSTQNVAIEALVCIWSDSRFEGTRIEISNWILDALWHDIFAVAAFFVPSMPAETKFEGASETDLIFRSLAISSRNGAAEEYLQWLLSRIGMEPSHLDVIADSITEHIVGFFADHDDTDEEKTAAKVGMGLLLELLPVELKERLKLIPEMLQRFGFTSPSLVSFGETSFEDRSVWNAAALALTGTPTTVESAESENYLLRKEGECGLLFEPADREASFHVNDPLFAMLEPAEAKRLERLSKLRSKLDVSKTEATQIFPKLAGYQQVELRMKELIELRNKSVVAQIGAFGDKLYKTQRLDLSLAKPLGTQSLLRHLRLPPRFEARQLPDLLDLAAATLIEEEGFCEAFLRMASIPLELPPSLKTAFGNMTEADRKRFFETFLDRPSGALPSLQAALLALSTGGAERHRGVPEILRLISTDYRQKWDLFSELLEWTYSWLLTAGEADPFSAEVLLCSWLHASHLHHILSPVNETEQLRKFFETTPGIALNAFRPELLLCRDAASPKAFRLTRTLLFAISQIPGDRLSPEELAALRPALTELVFPRGQTGIPDLSLLQQRTNAPNELGSFLGGCTTGKLELLLGADAASRIADETIAMEVEKFLSFLGADASHIESWLGLFVYLGTQRPAPHHADQLRTALLALSFKSFSTIPAVQLKGASFFCFAQLLNVPDFPYAVARDKLLDLVDVIRENVDSLSRKEAAELIVTCSLFVCNLLSPEPEAARSFTAILGEIGSRWPDLAGEFLGKSTRLVLRHGSSIRLHAWKGIADLRSVARTGLLR